MTGSPMPVSKLRVLVIDDDHAVADTLTLVLNSSGYRAVAAYSGNEGIALATQGGFDHLITDVTMLPMNGIQAAIAIRAICPECTILLISGHEQTTSLLADAVRDGHAFEILAKPVHPTQILDRLSGSH